MAAGGARAGSVADLLRQVELLFSTLGQRAYSGEPVSQLEHALQSAQRAQADGASEFLVVAALLHDIGHLVHDQGETPSARGIDDLHQFCGAHFLQRWFGRAVCEPIRLHVQAKRYLCAVQPDYLSVLSPDSLRSLALQGGPMDAASAEAFSQTAFSADAMRLRLWDDAAMVPGCVTPPLSFFFPLIARCALKEAIPC